MPQNHRISVGLSSTEHTELRELSEKHRVSVAWLGREAIVELLERSRSKEFQIPLELNRDHNRVHKPGESRRGPVSALP